MVDTTDRITEFLRETNRLIGDLDRNAIAEARRILLECYRRKGRVFTIGNGGSASTAQHFACDLAKYVIPEGGRPFDVRCLTDNMALYTAWANDAAREEVFCQPDARTDYRERRRHRHFRARRQRVLGRPGARGGFRQPGGSGDHFSGGVRWRRHGPDLNLFDPGPGSVNTATEAIHLVIEHLLVHLLKEDLAADAQGRS